HRAFRPQRLPGPRYCRLLPRPARSRTGPRPPGDGDRQALRVARPRADMDQPPVGRRPRSRPQHRPPPDPPLPGPPEGRLPSHRTDRRPQARRGEGRTSQGRPVQLEKKVAAGRWKLYYLDQCGFSPSLPTGYSWCLPGQRKRVKYEYPQGRRVNVLATYAPYGPEPWLDAVAFERTLTSDDLIAYLKERLPAASVPPGVVLDNASLPVSKVVKAARPALARLGIYLYYLPPYSPELNEIEAVFKQVKHHEIPRRSHTSKAELRGSVEQGFDCYGKKLRLKRDKQLR